MSRRDLSTRIGRPVVGGAVAIAIAELRELQAKCGLTAEDIAADPDLWVATLEGETSVVELILRYACVSRTMSELRQGADQRLEDLKVRRDRFARHEEQARCLVRYLMEAGSLRSLPTAEMTVSMSDGREGVEILDEVLVPTEFDAVPKSPERRIDKARLQDAVLRDGQEVPGVVLKRGNPILRIRWR